MVVFSPYMEKIILCLERKKRIFTWKSFLPVFVSWTRAPDGGSGVEKKGEKKKWWGVEKKKVRKWRGGK